MRIAPRHGGWLEMVCGPMFSGKSEELMRRLTRATIARQGVELLRSSVDTRHGPDEVVDHLTHRGIRVVCSGLDMDYRRRPWPVTQALLARAEFADKLQAVCLQCGGPGTLSQRLESDGSPASEAGPAVEIGNGERYEARCRACYRTGT